MSASATSFASAPLRPLRQLYNTQQLHRFLFRRVHVPLGITTSLVKGARYVWNPSQVSARARLAREIGVSREAQELKEKGYTLFPTDRFPEIDGVTTTCQDIFDASDEATRRLHHKKKNFLISVLKDKQFLDYPEVFQFASSRQLLDIATGYFGSVPMLSGMSLWWTPPNASEEQSQLFHADREDFSVLKMFFNIQDVTDENGPFTLIPADVSDRIKDAIHYQQRRSSRVSDAEVESADAMKDCVVVKGPRNAGACVDTNRCLHFGSRGNSKSRLVLMIRFTRCLAPNIDLPNWYEGMRGYDLDLDEVQKLAFGLQP